MKETAYQEDRKLFWIIRFSLIAFIVLFTMFPIYWMVATSFKPVQEWTPPKPIWVLAPEERREVGGVPTRG